MNRFTRSILTASILTLPLAGCSSMPDFSGDPTDWFNVDFLNNKKPLPGVRKPVFPEGVPGVSHGVPQDLVKGHQPPPDTEFAQDPAAQGSAAAPAVEQAAVEEKSAPPPKPKAKPRPKPKAKVAAKPAPVEAAPPEQAPTPVTVRRSSPQPSSQWPDPPSQQQSRPAATQWPDPPAPRNSAPSAVQWPDPPAPR
jgi:hypothetical protein